MQEGEIALRPFERLGDGVARSAPPADPPVVGPPRQPGEPCGDLRAEAGDGETRRGKARDRTDLCSFSGLVRRFAGRQPADRRPQQIAGATADPRKRAGETGGLFERGRARRDEARAIAIAGSENDRQRGNAPVEKRGDRRSLAAGAIDDRHERRKIGAPSDGRADRSMTRSAPLSGPSSMSCASGHGRPAIVRREPVDEPLEHFEKREMRHGLFCDAGGGKMHHMAVAAQAFGEIDMPAPRRAAFDNHVYLHFRQTLLDRLFTLQYDNDPQSFALR